MIKRIKKYKVIIGLVLIAIAIYSIISISNNKKLTEIDKVLKTEAYSYLPEKSKEYIKEIYDNTGTIVKTEKNKEENIPYLNPKYIEYLELSDKEKKEIDLIPDTYILDYFVNESYESTTFPSSYDLRNVDGKVYVSPIKNQGATNICWTFATVQNVETLYMKNNNQSYSDLIPEFSTRQMDYATSTNGMIKAYADSSIISCIPTGACAYYPYNNPENGSRELLTGGNFFTSAIAMYNGITLTSEEVLPWNEDDEVRWPKDILNYDNSLFEVDSTIHMPTINADTASTPQINSYVKEIKNYMTQYGGPFIGTYSPDSTCGFENTDGKKAMKTDDCVSDTNTQNKGHAMQIIGWDDNYEYSYCDAGTKHYSVKNGSCTAGVLTTGTGAWILKNSWGTESSEAKSYSYVYLTYDSTRLSIGFTTSISDMKTRSWDYNYHNNPWVDGKLSGGLASVSSQTVTHNTHNSKAEKIEKIKFMTSSKNGKYTLTIKSGNKEYKNIATASNIEVGVYTFNLSEKNILVDSKDISVTIEATNGATFFNDTISIFTSNTSEEPEIETTITSGITTYYETEDEPSPTNPAYIKSTTSTKLKMYHYIKNVEDPDKITYRALLDGEDHSRYFFDSGVETPVKLDGYIEREIPISEEDYSNVEICGKEYVFEILYDDKVIQSFPIKRICNNWDGKTTDYTKSSVTFHKNDGSGYTTVEKMNDLNNYRLMTADGKTNYYFGNRKAFFSYDKYIKSWNTEPDGSGVTYKDNNLYVYKDIDLYAQWSDPETEKHIYSLIYQCSSKECSDTEYTVSKKYDYEFNKEFNILENPFINVTSGKEFIYWETNKNIYYEDEIAMNITEYGYSSPYNAEENTYLDAVWSDSYYTINFDANGGTGTMKSIKMLPDEYKRLKYNSFTKEGYTFKNWNTASDGTGTSYLNAQQIKPTTDMTLYAQWEQNKIKITFNPNDGTVRTSTQTIAESVPTKLNANIYTRIGYTFKNWNTASDGTGTSYTDEQTVTLKENTSLYAQWTINTYTLTYNSNSGTGTMPNQTFTYNKSDNLNDIKFTKDGYVFKEWNTKPDGTGTSYINKQSIAIVEDTTLYAIWLEGPAYTINTYTHNKNNNYITNINSYTKVKDYLKNVVANERYNIAVYKGNEKLPFDYFVPTGSKTKISYKDEIIIEFTNVVKGEVTGDGELDFLDYVNVYNHISKTLNPNSNKKLLKDEYLSAADMSGDTEIDFLDYVYIYNEIKKHI